MKGRGFIYDRRENIYCEHCMFDGVLLCVSQDVICILDVVVNYKTLPLRSADKNEEDCRNLSLCKIYTLSLIFSYPRFDYLGIVVVHKIIVSVQV